jgi:hypothetical protein
MLILHSSSAILPSSILHSSSAILPSSSAIKKRWGLRKFHIACCFQQLQTHWMIASHSMRLGKKNSTNLGPEWPSPHDCTSSVSDELVLIQLLNLVQSPRLNHTFFGGGGAFQEIFFLHLRTSPAHPVQKKIPTYPVPLLMLWNLFFKALSFCCHCQCYNCVITHFHCWCSKKN